MNSDSETIRRRTRGRSARVREAALRATLDVLKDVGAEGLTLSEIARRAGVHATSIQRRWGSAENVLLEALLDLGQEAIPIPDTGSLRGDLLTVARELAAYLANPLGKAIVKAMAARTDDHQMAANRAKYFRVRFEAASVMIDRAAARGELRLGVDSQMAIELLSAPFYYRVLITGQPIDDAFTEDVVDTLLRGLLK